MGDCAKVRLKIIFKMMKYLKLRYTINMSKKLMLIMLNMLVLSVVAPYEQDHTGVFVSRAVIIDVLKSMSQLEASARVGAESSSSGSAEVSVPIKVIEAVLRSGSLLQARARRDMLEFISLHRSIYSSYITRTII